MLQILLVAQRKARFLLTGILIFICCFDVCAQQSAASAQSTCVDYATIIKDNNAGDLAAQAVTRVVPAEGDARFVFRKPLETANPQHFRVFNIPDGSEVSVVSVEPAPEKLVSGYRPSDSVLLHLDIPAKSASPWDKRTFIIVECTDGKFKSWARVQAHVSAAYVSLFCIPVALVCFGLSIFAVYKSREETVAGLITKYPAVFGAKKFDKIDFFNPIQLAANAFNQGSVQKLQVLLFSFLIGCLVLSLVLRTGTLADMSATIVGLLGISGIGAAVSQVTYTSRTRLSCENWSWLQSRNILKPSEPRGPQWKDLVLTNREFDVYKLQTIIFSLAVAAALVAAGASDLATFEIPSAMLGVLGLSQVVFVGGILVRPPATGDLDDTLKGLRAAADLCRQAKERRMDVDSEGKLVAISADVEPGLAAKRRYEKLATDAVPMIESTLEVEVDEQKLLSICP
ncbi:hypothetical protein [Caballeronia sp. DA-9]|uniref:hypothetical protein n=1 Tax=Caballeronia sp. DA-9 TaxID=3436237 RepID=UPI003F66FF21